MINTPYRRDLNGEDLSPETLMMSYGYDPELSEGSIKPPIFLTSTFVFKSAEEGKDFFNIVSGRTPAPAEQKKWLGVFTLQSAQQRNRGRPPRLVRTR